jgi:hypothetical protein
LSEELGKIEKPSVEEFQGERRLFFVPLIFCGKDAPSEYVERFNKYWSQVEDQISNLELKLGSVHKILHELITASNEEAMKVLKELNEKSYEIIKKRLDKGAQIEAFEDSELMAELMDWSKCLSVGLQSQKAFTSVYGSYTEVSKNRNEHIAKQIDSSLKAGDIGLLFMREGHQIQFPQDTEVFYIAPPGLDEIKRWLADQEVKHAKDATDEKK